MVWRPVLHVLSCIFVGASSVVRLFVCIFSTLARRPVSLTCVSSICSTHLSISPPCSAYFRVFSCIFVYFRVFSCIFVYFRVFWRPVPVYFRVFLFLLAHVRVNLPLRSVYFRVVLCAIWHPGLFVFLFILVHFAATLRVFPVFSCIFVH